MNPLKLFYENEAQREAVREFMLQCLNKIAIERVMNRKDTNSLADAKDVVESLFIILKETYSDVPKPTVSSSR